MTKVFLFFSFILLIILTPLTLAQESFTFSDEDDDQEGKRVVILAPDQVINKDYFAAGDIVEISGTVNGDVYIAGGQVIVDGVINGDLLAAGGTINISGKISDDARIAGGQVNVSGEIGRNLTIGAGNIDITKDAILSGSFVGGAGSINIAAPVTKDLKIGSGNLIIGNKIGGDVEVGVGELSLTSKAQIEGDLTYWSDKSASIAKDATIAGQLKHNLTPGVEKPKPESFLKALVSLFALFKFISIISTLIIGLLILRLLPVFTGTVSEIVSKKTWAAFGIGLLILILVPIVFLVLLITIIGIPIAIILLLIYIMYLYVARIFVIFWLGKYLVTKLNWKANSYWMFILGLIIYYIITFIPILGELIALIILSFGVGSLILGKIATYKQIRKKNLI